jgi:hypothetical protein
MTEDKAPELGKELNLSMFGKEETWRKFNSKKINIRINDRRLRPNPVGDCKYPIRLEVFKDEGQLPDKIVNLFASPNTLLVIAKIIAGTSKAKNVQNPKIKVDEKTLSEGPGKDLEERFIRFSWNEQET